MITFKTRKETARNAFLQHIWVRKWSFLFILMGFLLGRATILDQFAPFSIAYFAAIYFLRKDLLRWVFIALIAGSALSPQGPVVYITAEMVVFALIQYGLEKFERTAASMAPIVVFCSVFLVKLFSFMVKTELSWYVLTMTLIEAGFAFILTLIFMQAVPVLALSKKSFNLKNEEVVCLMILLASVMTGTLGWQIGPVTVEHVLSRFLILLFAFVGGAPLGAAVGVVTGLILSLADVHAINQISLLAFSGLLAGLLKDGRKIGVSMGLLIGSSILSVYLGVQQQVVESLWDSGAAIVLFMLVPRSGVRMLAQYVPGTQEHARSQHEYARRIRDVTAGRVRQFSEVFRQLSRSFAQLSAGGETEQERDKEHFMNGVAERACVNCHRRKQCWEEKFYRTYSYMTEMMTAIEENESFAKRDIRIEWRQACSRTEQVLEQMKRQHQQFKFNRHWRKQIQDSRQLVADQLSGVSQVMEDLANEIKREGQQLFVQEEQIRQALEQLGLSIHDIDIVSLDPGSVYIEIVHQYSKGFDECRKIIAPLLSDILGENIVVKAEEIKGKEEGAITVKFGSAKEYEVETGLAAAAKGGDLLSGDSFSTMELGNGKFAVSVSDGMGNGERAKLESSTALSVLQQLLQSGMDERLAVKSVNSVLLLRSSEEIYATIDMAIIDLFSAQTTFMKIASTPSYIKRGKEVFVISANNLPVGILNDIEVDLVTFQLQPGDIIIMMSDGIFDAPGHSVNKEIWMKRVIQDIATEDPQELADCLLECVVRSSYGEIGDDMTVVVAKLQKFKPDWATISWPGMTRLERPRTVS